MDRMKIDDQTKSFEEEPLKPYQHTQIGYLIIVSFSLAQIGIMVSFVMKREMILLLPFLLISIVEVLFFLLTVRVDEVLIHIKFGIGLIQKAVPLSDVSSCQVVRNSPLCGWGIRCIGNGWLYNVLGLNAVEILLKNGQRARIGTDEPEGLLNAIQIRIDLIERV